MKKLEETMASAGVARGRSAAEAGEGGRMLYDPICGRKLSGVGGAPTAEYKKRRYYFCSEGCRHVFEAEAEKLKMGELAKAGALLSQGRVRWGLA